MNIKVVSTYVLCAHRIYLRCQQLLVLLIRRELHSAVGEYANYICPVTLPKRPQAFLPAFCRLSDCIDIPGLMTGLSGCST